MPRLTTLTLTTVVAVCVLEPTTALPQGETRSRSQAAVQEYSGMCDASTAVAVGPDRFLVVNDEDNVLRLYRSDTPGAPLATKSIKEFLTLENPNKEADIEGSARLGETLYWITSHGRNKDGEIKRNRYQFFALTPKSVDGEISLERTGKPYTRLLEDMLEENRLKGFKLDPLKPEKEPNRAPEKKDSTNIEGLAAWWDNQLLIAFRNPIPGQKALLVPLKNPARVVAGEKAQFGDPIQLDLGGLGIRSIEFWPHRNIYLIVAGPFDDEGTFQLYTWSGDPARQPERIEGADLSGLNPEAIVIYPDKNDQVQLLSDDGGVKTGNTECKDLEDATRKTFRGRWISVPGC
jgi:Protein of unknown function (DUF3616)